MLKIDEQPSAGRAVRRRKRARESRHPADIALAHVALAEKITHAKALGFLKMIRKQMPNGLDLRLIELETLIAVADRKIAEAARANGARDMVAPLGSCANVTAPNLQLAVRISLPLARHLA
jgi:hypothetical protein